MSTEELTETVVVLPWLSVMLASTVNPPSGSALSTLIVNVPSFSTTLVTF